MALSGSLEDISIVDVLQILGMAGKNGVLHLDREDQKAQIAFSDGRVVAVTTHPRLSFLTDILIERGHLTQEKLLQALERQRDQGTRHIPLGSTLLEIGAVTVAHIEDAVSQSILAAVGEIASWTDGEFWFEPGGMKPPVDPLFIPETVAVEVSISPQELLLEAARIHDEAMEAQRKRKAAEDREAGEAEPAAEKAAEGETADAATGTSTEEPGQQEDLAELTEEEVMADLNPPAILLSPDPELGGSLIVALKEKEVTLHPARTFEDARYLLVRLAGRHPLLVVDTDMVSADLARGQQGIHSVLQQRRESGNVPILTFGSGKNPRLMAGVLSAGVVSHVPRPVQEKDESPEAFQRFIGTMAQLIRKELSRMLPEEGTVPRNVQPMTYVGSLYHTMLDLRRSYHSVTVSLDVLRFVADYLERAVLFLVKEASLVGLGGFGLRGTGGSDPGKSLPKLRITIPEGSPIFEVIKNGTVQMVTELEGDKVFKKLYDLVGAPVRSEALLIPIVVNERTTSLIYADNGTQDIEVCSPEPLGILVEHAGLLLENMLLRRKLAQ
jgi:hypothetical protein